MRLKFPKKLRTMRLGQNLLVLIKKNPVFEDPDPQSNKPSLRMPRKDMGGGGGGGVLRSKKDRDDRPKS